jgi:hypothetical protein
MLARGLAAPYASERVALHRAELARALSYPAGERDGVRNLAAHM